jgi:quercetin dioxygenase-like cupin family protein
MFLKWFFALLSLCGLASTTGFAQDPTTVAPTHYRLAFENEQVKVLYIHYGPHEKSVLHDHPAGMVVNITGGHLKFTDQKGNAQEIHALRGEARWFPALKHTVENMSAEPYEGVYIAVKKGAARQASHPAGPGDEQATKLVAAEILRELALSTAGSSSGTPAESRQQLGGSQVGASKPASATGSEKIAKDAR